MKFGPASLLDLNTLHKAWYDWTLKDGAKPAFLKARVAYYMLGQGAEDWRYADTLEAVTAQRKPYYLSSEQGRANEVFASGRLEPAPVDGPQPVDSYVYDPLQPDPEVSNDDEGFLTSQALAMQAHGRQMLIYHSAPFAEATELAGFFRLQAWLALDQPDTDFLIGIYEVKPDGSSVFLGQDQMRARYRESLRIPKLVEPGAIERYDFDDFQFAARRIEKGSRLRLILMPRLSSWWYERNYNSGGVAAQESGKDARTVTVKLYHDTEHPSVLFVPIARQQGNNDK